MTSKLEKLIKSVPEDYREVRVYCASCGIVFLQISLKDYIRLRSRSEPDKWFIETGIHWCLNPDHQIIAELPLTQSINEIWEAKMLKDNLSREQMLAKFYEFREQHKDKPI